MIIRIFLLSMVAIGCSGCIGVAFDRTRAEIIEKPIPLKPHSSGPDRWACQPDPAVNYSTKNDFIESWGEPLSKEELNHTETWTYAEDNRWCGFWVAYIVPIPIQLPVCETYDKITFVNDLAVRASSRRFVRSGFGIGLAPSIGPVPVFFVEGKVTQDRPSIEKILSEEDNTCVSKPVTNTNALNEEGSLEDYFPQTVFCFSEGKRQWVERSLCDLK